MECEIWGRINAEKVTSGSPGPVRWGDLGKLQSGAVGLVFIQTCAIPLPQHSVEYRDPKAMVLHPELFSRDSAPWPCSAHACYQDSCSRPPWKSSHDGSSMWQDGDPEGRSARALVSSCLLDWRCRLGAGYEGVADRHKLHSSFWAVL